MPFYSKNRELLFLVTEVYIPFCNSENGDYITTPFEGCVMDQPYLTMRTLDLIKLNFKIYISEQQKARQEEMAQKAKRSRRK